MRVGATNLSGGGCSAASGLAPPGRRKRGSVVGLPPSDDGCSRSLPGIAVLPELVMLPEFAVLPVLTVSAAATAPNVGPGVCARPDSGNSSASAIKRAKAALFGTRQRRLRGDFLAPRAHTSATIRITSEVAKANHRQEAVPARQFSPCRNRDGPARAAGQAPMVNGVRTDMVNERLIYGRFAGL